MTDIYVPKMLFLATQAGHVARVVNADSGTPNFTDISPTASQIIGLGTAIKLIEDPFNARRLFLYGSQGAFVCDDATLVSTTWRSIRLSIGPVWQQPFDFTGGNAQGWQPIIAPGDSQPLGIIGAGGWLSNCGFYPVPGTHLNWVEIRLQFANAVNLTHVSATWDNEVTSNDGSATCLIQDLNPDLSGNNTLFTQDVVSGEQTMTWDGAYTFNANHSLDIIMKGGAGAHSCPGGNATTTLIIIRGTGVNPFGGSSTADETFVGDMAASVNKRGYFGWLTKVNGNLYYYYSLDNFDTVRRTLLATYNASMPYSVTLSSFYPQEVWVSAGNPGSSDAFVYHSIDGGGHFSPVSGSALSAGGGVVLKPYKALDGENNV